MNRVNGGDVLDYEMLQLQTEDVHKSRKSSLASTVVVGAEYGFFENKLGSRCIVYDSLRATENADRSNIFRKLSSEKAGLTLRSATRLFSLLVSHSVWA